MKGNHDLTKTSPEIPRAVIRKVEQAADAQRDQPVMLRPGPVLTLLMMLCRRETRACRRSESGLPAGCVLVVRDQSR
jgi:hypothetical protein